MEQGTEKRTNKQQLLIWKDITSFLNKWYYKPDTMALKVALSQYTSHFRFNNPPAWLFFLAPSSAGKSTLVCRPVTFMPFAYSHGEMTASTLLSGYGKEEGLLDKLPAIPGQPDRTHGVLCISDFSSILKLMPDVREKIQAQLREVYDGHYTKSVGNKDGMEWKGKVTILACCTPSIEKYWSLGHELGERFLMYRMPAHDSMEELNEIQEYAGMHSGTIKVGPKDTIAVESYLQAEYKRLITKFVAADVKWDLPTGIDDMDIWKSSGLIEWGTLLAKMRQGVSRDMRSPKREIISIEEVESTARLHKALKQLAIGYSMLFREQHISQDAIELAKRVCQDSIPKNRWKVLDTVVRHNGKLNISDIRTLTGIPYTSTHQIVEDMCALDILRTVECGGCKVVEVVEKIANHLHGCGKKYKPSPNDGVIK